MTKQTLIKYGLDNDLIDLDKSIEIFDEDSFTTIIHLYFKKTKRIICPECGVIDSKIVGSKISRIKSSSSVETNYIVNLHRRKFKCNSCGRVFSENNPYSYLNHSLSFNKTICVLNALKNKEKTFKSIAQEFDISETTVIDIFDRFVDIKPHKLPVIVSFDEVHVKKLTKHSYCFIIFSPFESKIIDVTDSRHKEDLFGYFNKKTNKELKNVKYVSIDLYNNYREIAKKCFYDAKICADPFHVIKNISTAFNNIRIMIMNKYKDYKGENNHRYWLLKKFWKITLMDPSKLTYKRFKIRKLDMWLSQKEILFEILKTDPLLEKAHDLLQEYREFNATYTIDDCRDKLDLLISKFLSFPSDYYNKIGKMLKNWHDEIINSFTRINGKRITNGFIERKNKDIRIMIRLANGFKNFIRFRNRVLYCLNIDEPILANPKTITNKRRSKSRGKYRNNH